MRPLSVVYVGLAMSGRASSVSSVLRGAGTRSDYLLLDPHGPHRARVAQTEVQLRIANHRSNVLYAPEDPRLDDRIRLELGWLANADGIVFVIDSQEARVPNGLEDLERLRRDLTSRSQSLDEKVVVFQANKRDLKGIAAIEALRGQFRTGRCEMVESVATRDAGTMEALTRVVELAQ